VPEPWHPPGITQHERIHRVDDDLWGVTFGIDYLDWHHNQTTRRISLRHLYRSDEQVLYLQAYCYEREAVRTFRFDRIQAIHDADGVIHDPREFFETELHIRVGATAAGALADPPAARPRREALPARLKKPGLDKLGFAPRHAARDGLRVLIMLGRTDGRFRESELAVVVLDYIVARAAAEGIETTEDDRAALMPYLRRQHPDAEVLSECLDRLEREPSELRQLLMSSAVALMDADGIEHPAEFAMMLSLRERLGRRRMG
jgi:WYL domain